MTTKYRAYAQMEEDRSYGLFQRVRDAVGRFRGVGAKGRAQDEAARQDVHGHRAAGLAPHDDATHYSYYTKHRRDDLQHLSDKYGPTRGGQGFPKQALAEELAGAASHFLSRKEGGAKTAESHRELADQAIAHHHRYIKAIQKGTPWHGYDS